MWLLNPRADPYWDGKIRVLKHKSMKYEGKTVSEIAAMLGRDLLDTFFNDQVEDHYVRAAYADMVYEEEVMEYITFSLDFKWELESVPSLTGTLSLEEAVKKITYMQASVVGRKSADC